MQTGARLRKRISYKMCTTIHQANSAEHSSLKIDNPLYNKKFMAPFEFSFSLIVYRGSKNAVIYSDVQLIKLQNQCLRSLSAEAEKGASYCNTF